jgi:hypothetical protein
MLRNLLFLHANFSCLLRDRAEKEKCQYLCELNDIRASLDHISNEKVCFVTFRSAFVNSSRNSVYVASVVLLEGGGKKVYVILYFCV